MAFLASRPLGLSLGLGCALTSYAYLRPTPRPYYCDASPSASSTFASATNPRDWSASRYQRDAQVPIVGKKGGLNPRAVRQISSGSIAGVLGGLAVSVFSKPLALLIGLLIVGVQFAESQLHISLIPYKRLQRYMTSVDLRSAVQDNVAFKLAFGSTFALTGFAQL